jgi:phosphoribosylaminoimidazole carboxylase PurE protein
MASPLVGVLMGSESDLGTMETCLARLSALEVPFEVSILSAHRTPERTREYVASARDRGLRVLVAAAGGAAHLAGFAAAHTDLPVIGVPMDSGVLTGLDALLATVQMPGGFPVATVSVGRWGADNAAILAAQIVALHDESLRVRIAKMREGFAAKVTDANRRVRAKWSGDGD